MQSFYFERHKEGKINLYVIKEKSGSRLIAASCTVNKKQVCWRLGLNADNINDIKIAIDLAKQADEDLKSGQFDLSLVAYKFKAKIAPTPVSQNNIIQLPVASTNYPTLIELIKQYQEIKVGTISNNTESMVTSALKRLEKLDQCALSFGNTIQLLKQLRENYAETTIDKTFEVINMSILVARQLGQIDKNPYFGIKALLKLRESDEDDIKCFSPSQVKEILSSIKHDKYISPNLCNNFTDSFYYPYIAFCALTGCRPSEAIALTWSDFKRYPDGKFMVVISKAHQGKKNGEDIIGPTKTDETRTFRANSSLINLIDSIPKLHKSLVFPSQTGKYLTQNNFNRRIWKRVLEGLNNDFLVDEYLSPYHLRHSFVTAMIEKGIEIKSIAGVCGNSAKVISDHYWARKKQEKIEQTIFPSLF